MLGFSLSKLLVLAALIAAAWYGLRWVQRRTQLQQSADRDRVERSAEPESEELVACPRCGVFAAAGTDRSCERDDCPL